MSDNFSLFPEFDEITTSPAVKPAKKAASKPKAPPEEEAPFTPSAYQEAIFAFQQSDTRDAFVNAVAGSGKTTTIIECAKLLPLEQREKALFVAFNNHIIKALQKRLPPGIEAATIHSIGNKAMKAHAETLTNPNLDKKWGLEIYKYGKLSRQFVTQQGLDFYDKRTGRVVRAITDMLKIAMLTLTDMGDEAALRNMAAYYDVEVDGPDWPLVLMALPKVRDWGIKGSDIPDRDGRCLGIAECWAFEDQIYLPNYLDLPMPQYEMIYCDEAQDLSAAQRELVLKLRAPGGRIIFVGDRNQAIYAFAGADARSVQAIEEATGAVRLPLNVCYRCPTSHVELAKVIVPEIEAAPDARKGIVQKIRRENLPKFLRPEDRVLCRTTAPLIDLAFTLILSDCPAHVLGKEISSQLSAIVDAVEGVVGYSWERFDECLNLYRARRIAVLQKRDNSELEIESLFDRVESVRLIHDRKVVEGTVSCAADLKKVISELFNEKRGSIELCTVHRAKGLEADRIFILQEELMPHPKSVTPQQMKQEMNLRYVALTRAKQELWFIIE